jgi:hypothetical protein
MWKTMPSSRANALMPGLSRVNVAASVPLIAAKTAAPSSPLFEPSRGFNGGSRR